MISMVSASFAPKLAALRVVSLMPSTLVKLKEDTGPKVGDDRKGGPLLNSPSERVKAQRSAFVLGLRALGPSSATLTVAQQVRFRGGAIVPMPPGRVGSNQDGVGIVGILGVRALGRVVTIRIDGPRLCGESCAPSGARLEVGGGLCR